MTEDLFHPYYHQRCKLETPSQQREGILHANNGYVQFFYREGGTVRGLDFYPADLVLRQEGDVPHFVTSEERRSFPVSGIDAVLMKFYLRRARVDKRI